ncbi:uncharacterized protein LOC135694482 [Rhopilema esculentum]|uniref:uncharacterized protein LOC135694482 n=1 Tax=Rhopilema esculentum TaxID=499914 RepID=UPI0031E3C3FE
MAYEAKQKATDYWHNPVGQPRRQKTMSCFEDEEYDAMDSHKYFGQNKDSRKPTVSRYNFESQTDLGHSFPKWRVSAPNSNSASVRTNRVESQLSGNGKRRKKWQEDNCEGYRDSWKTSFGTPSTVRLAPSKKRRLTFEKDPSSRDGQTRLSFR